MSRSGQIQTYYTASGLPRYQIEIWHDELNKYQLIKGQSNSEVWEKANVKMSQWDKAWNKQLKKEIASKRTLKALEDINELKCILKNKKNISFNFFYKKRIFQKPKPRKDIYHPPYPKEPQYPVEPQITDPKYKPTYGLLDELFSNRKKKKRKEKENLFNSDHLDWATKVSYIKKQYEEELSRVNEIITNIENKYKNDIAKWKKEKYEYLRQIDYYNEKIQLFKKKYENGNIISLSKYIEKVLNMSTYPDPIPKKFEIEFNPVNKILIVDYQLPSLDDIPKLKEIRYIQSRDEFDEKFLSSNEFNKLYDNSLYQIVLRVSYEIYNADYKDIIESIIFNGFVSSIDPATGILNDSCIMSFQTQKQEFMKINLDDVDPKTCFRKFKGIGSSKLHSITPIKPLLSISREDKRFVEGYKVADNLESGYNIAVMDWLDFENLIKEIFEREFSKDGGEVKVTRSSRDGGVDAVAFDSDPIRGGKIVIQAKRYTNTVGVSAIRDLYGTVVNEGAMKGIIITTSDYGPDAYQFAKDKPLTLLNGGHLLHMLRKHGLEVKIDLQEAKEILAGKEKSSFSES